MHFSKKHLFTLSFLTTLGLIILHIGGVSNLLSLGVSICIYGLFFYVLHVVWMLIRGKLFLSIKEFTEGFLYRVSAGLFIIISVVGGFAYYQNDINPAKMPLYSLSNGSKEVRFQTMSHIGSKSFYENVKLNIKKGKQEGFILFYEGVRPGSEESMENFNEAIGIDFNPELYENFSKLYGVDHQKNPEFLGISNDKDYNIDLDMDTIMSIYEEKTGSIEDMPNNTMERQEKRVADISGDIIERLAGLSEKELSILRYVNKSILNFIIKNAGFRDMMVTRFGNQDLFTVILDDRNIHLVENILSSESNNIFIIYGLMHFDGVLSLLQESDLKWKIQSIEYIHLID